MFGSRSFRFLFLSGQVGASLVFGGLAAAQNDLALAPSAPLVEVGVPFEISVNPTFADASVGGGVTLVYDHALLSFDSVSFAAGDPDFLCPAPGGIACPANADYLSFGDVGGLPPGSTLATLTFTPLASGTFTLSMQPTTPFGAIGGAPLVVNLAGTSVVSGAPELPALAPWGLASLIAALVAAFFLASPRLRRGLPGILILLALVGALGAPPSRAQIDSDLDGIDDAADNCTNTANSGQTDSNGDGYGNACDPDLDNDGDVDGTDLGLLKAVFFGANADADLDGNGTVDFLDLGIMANHYGGAPGPRCPACPLTQVSQSYCASGALGLAIPDDDPAGAADVRTVTDNVLIADLNVSVQIAHGWVGDLSVTLAHGDTGTSVALIDQPGVPASSFGCSASDIDAVLDDAAASSAEAACASPAPALAGDLSPSEPLAAFVGENLAGTWTLTARDLSLGVSGSVEQWCLAVNDPPPPPPPPVPLSVEIIAYRPQSEAYGAPLLRRRVPESEEQGLGAGIRINGDDDDGDSTPDAGDSAVPGENDLIEVEWAVGEAPAPPGYEYVLRRSSGNIVVWTSPTKGTAILDSGLETVVEPGATTGSVWIENPGGGSASLVLEARSTSDLSVAASDQIDFFAFTSLVIGLHGEFQFPTDPVFGPNEGISVLAIALHREAYDSHMYVENEVEADGSGSVYDEIVSAVQNRGVTNLAIYGFSHGGGSIYDLSERLEANKSSIGNFDLLFTGYIDSLENDSDADLDAEVRLPIGTQYHVNYYQSSLLWWVWGDSVPGSDVDQHVTGVSHITITNHLGVQSGIHDPLVARVPR